MYSNTRMILYQKKGMLFHINMNIIWLREAKTLPNGVEPLASRLTVSRSTN